MTSTGLALAILAGGAARVRGAEADRFERLQGDVDARLAKSLAELSRERERIAQEKIPLSKAVYQLESDVLALRREQQRLLELRDSRTIDLTSLRKQVASLQEQDDFVDSRLNEFVRDFEGRLDISELPRYEAKTAAAKLADQNANLDAEGKRSTQLAVVVSALSRLEAQIGGEIYPGEALGPDGVLTTGRFVALGPTVYYASDDGRVTGLVESQLNAADPVVVELPGGFDSQIAAIAASGSGELPFDATLGKALKKEKARKGLLAHIEDGGVVGYVIIALGAAAVLLTGFKFREISGFEVVDAEQVDGILDELTKGNEAAAAWQAQRIDGISGEMLATGVAHAHDKRSLLEELLFEKILRVRPTLERFLPFLAITAAAAPLLGLLGTVIGMIKTFQLITIFGTGDAKSLSSGISEALVTTALGLIVAIPTLLLHGALTRMAKHKIGLLEQLSVAFVNGVSSIRGGAEAPTKGRSLEGV
jgi:biopolymer transport protein ExbB